MYTPAKTAPAADQQKISRSSWTARQLDLESLLGPAERLPFCIAGSERCTALALAAAGRLDRLHAWRGAMHVWSRLPSQVLQRAFTELGTKGATVHDMETARGPMARLHGQVGVLGDALAQLLLPLGLAPQQRLRSHTSSVNPMICDSSSGMPCPFTASCMTCMVVSVKGWRNLYLHFR